MEFPPNGFQDRPVMTASVTLRKLRLAQDPIPKSGQMEFSIAEPLCQTKVGKFPKAVEKEKGIEYNKKLEKLVQEVNTDYGG